MPPEKTRHTRLKGLQFQRKSPKHPWSIASRTTPHHPHHDHPPTAPMFKRSSQAYTGTDESKGQHDMHRAERFKQLRQTVDGAAAAPHEDVDMCMQQGTGTKPHPRSGTGRAGRQSWAQGPTQVSVQLWADAGTAPAPRATLLAHATGLREQGTARVPAPVVRAVEHTRLAASGSMQSAQAPGRGHVRMSSRPPLLHEPDVDLARIRLEDLRGFARKHYPSHEGLMDVIPAHLDTPYGFPSSLDCMAAGAGTAQDVAMVSTAAPDSPQARGRFVRVVPSSSGAVSAFV